MNELPKFRAKKIDSEEVVDGNYVKNLQDKHYITRYIDYGIYDFKFYPINPQTIELTFNGIDWYKVSEMDYMIKNLKYLAGVEDEN